MCVGLYPPKPLCAGGKARSRPVGVCCADLTRCGEQIRNAFFIRCIYLRVRIRGLCFDVMGSGDA